MATSRPEAGEKDHTPGRVTFLDGQNEMPAIEVSTAWSMAEIYLHGAHVTQFKKKNEPPLLFMSQFSRFTENQPIRGGIPVIFPWFGMREGLGQHGFARTKPWDLKEVVPAADGSVSVRFRFPECPEASTWTPFSADYIVKVDEALTLELQITNRSATEPFTFENCLHTYFAVGNISAISIAGLKGITYLDKVKGFAQRVEQDEAIRISSEVDRIYLDTTQPVEILDPQLGRKIRIDKAGSASTVVWNPWIAKAQQMQDFGDDEYQRMVCVESGNVGENEITLAPGGTSSLRVTLSTQPLGA